MFTFSAASHKHCLLFVVLGVLLPVLPASAETIMPHQSFPGLIASVDLYHSDPYEQLRQIERFYLQISKSRLDHGWKVASMYLEGAYATGDSAYISKGYHLRGVAYSQAGDFLKAMKDYMSSLKISEALGDSISMNNTYNNLGILFEKLEQGTQAQYYFEKSLDFEMRSGNLTGAASVLNNLGNLYNNMGEVDKALDALTQALEIWVEVDDTLTIPYTLGNIGNVYMSHEDYPMAEHYFHRSKTLFSKYNDSKNLAYTYLNLGKIKHLQEDYQSALAYYDKGLCIANSAHQIHLASLFYKAMAQTYANQNQFEPAYHYEIKHGHLKDSLLNQEAIEQIALYQTMYETENKEREIELLRKDQELRELQLNQKNASLQKARMRATILLFFLIISILSVFILVIRNRHKRMRIINAGKLQAQREQMKAVIKTQEDERIRFARDLHDGLGQILTALRINLTHIRDADSHLLPDILNNANHMIKDMHQEIRHISFNIMPQLLVQKGLFPALQELARKLSTAQGLSVNISQHKYTHRFDPPEEIAIYRILQEILNNIIKHGKAKHVDIQIIQHKQELNIHVEDDGVGFDTSLLEQSNGSGWKNICSRLKLLEAQISIDSKPDRKHSTVIIDIPLKRQT